MAFCASRIAGVHLLFKGTRPSLGLPHGIPKDLSQIHQDKIPFDELKSPHMGVWLHLTNSFAFNLTQITSYGAWLHLASSLAFNLTTHGNDIPSYSWGLLALRGRDYIGNIEQRIGTRATILEFCLVPQAQVQLPQLSLTDHVIYAKQCIPFETHFSQM